MDLQKSQKLTNWPYFEGQSGNPTLNSILAEQYGQALPAQDAVISFLVFQIIKIILNTIPTSIIVFHSHIFTFRTAYRICMFVLQLDKGKGYGTFYSSGSRQQNKA